MRYLNSAGFGEADENGAGRGRRGNRRLPRCSHDEVNKADWVWTGTNRVADGVGNSITYRHTYIPPSPSIKYPLVRTNLNIL